MKTIQQNQDYSAYIHRERLLMQDEEEEEDTMISISETDLASYFAKPYMYEQTPIGFAMGLANSEFGGIAWYLKTTLIEEGEAIGSGNLVGLVAMDTYESANIGYILAQEILCRKQPQNNFFVNSRICIHMPYTHGTSAGCTVTTSLLSLIKEQAQNGVVSVSASTTSTTNIKPTSLTNNKPTTTKGKKPNNEDTCLQRLHDVAKDKFGTKGVSCGQVLLTNRFDCLGSAATT